MTVADPRYLGQAEAWLDAVARLTYAQHRAESPAELNRLVAEVAEQRVRLLRTAVDGGWSQPGFLAGTDRGTALSVAS